MLPHTLKHYRSRFPNAVISIFDNYSTDRSVAIAEEAGCRVIPYDSKGQQDEKLLIWVRNHFWKHYVTNDWVIMCDMDEWLDITQEELDEEDKKGVTIITTQGFNMIGESKTTDYQDIDLFAIKKGVYSNEMSKNICFKYPDIHSMEFWYGAHRSFPQGRVVFSQKTYLLKHYDMLGQEYIVDKRRSRYARNEVSRMGGLNGHYVMEAEKTIEDYQNNLARAVTL